MKKNKISVLMTTFNQEKFIEDSINSICKQSYQNWEMIIIDNGSTDNTKKKLIKYKNKKIKKFFLKKNIGRTRCLNYGLNFCTGEYIAILDSDDIAYKNRFKIQLNFFNNNKNISLVGSDYQKIDENNQILEKKKIKNFTRDLLFKNTLAHSSVIFKKNLIKEIGIYPKKFIYSQDYAFYLKVIKNHEIGFIKKKLVKIRFHRNSESSKTSNYIKINENLELLKWSFKNLKPNLKEKIIIFISFLKLHLKKITLH